ncbi:MAG TPA: hypothetical protein VHF69_07085, partial [Candidatus Synoicihabitans sp.]|nr:hypothetical protein [Candidatus Synoicihabitans sp.]
LQRTPVLRASDFENALGNETGRQPRRARIVAERFDLMELAMLFTSARAALRPAIIYQVQLTAA